MASFIDNPFKAMGPPTKTIWEIKSSELPENIAALLADGWEPFAVDGTGRVHAKVWFRRLIQVPQESPE